MTTFTLSLHRGPVERSWQLGPVPPDPQRLMMLAWEPDPWPVDGGVPPPLAGVLVDALTAVARVSFLCEDPGTLATDEWTAVEGDAIRRRRYRHVLDRLTANLAARRAVHPALYSSVYAASVMRAFDEAVPWTLQAQALLLSSREAGPPDVGVDTAVALLDNDWATRAQALRGQGIEAVLRPGVDGDVIGVLPLTGSDLADRWLDELRRRALAAGMRWTE